jgi:hypothetical protein
VEWATFHCFHCNDIYPELRRKFGIALNNFGLIDSEENWREIVDYMNDEDTKVEPVHQPADGQVIKDPRL